MNSRMTETIKRLKRLVADLERLEAGTISAQALMAIPVLDDWAYTLRRAPCLEGKVAGHPYLPDGKVIITSELYAHFHADDEHFVRTLSRWYRLGTFHQNAKSHGGPASNVFEGQADETS